MEEKEPDLVSMLNEAGHTEQATSLATKIAADKAKAEQTEQERIAALSGNEKMNHALRNAGGNRHSGDVNADVRRAAGREAQS